MKKKLKVLFSPRNLIVWIFVVLLILTVPEITKPSMSQTEAIVTLLCIDKIDDEYVVATNILAPSQTKASNTQIYSSSGVSVADALNKLSLTIGKDIGLAQCEVMALGENLCDYGVMPAIDYLTRTKQVGRNAMLISFTGDVNEFAKLISNMDKTKSLKLENIMNFSEKYILSKECNIEAFLKGYYGPISTGYIPQIKIETEENSPSIEVSSNSNTNNQIANNENEKKYVVTDGTTVVFKQGKKYLVLEPDIAKKVNLFLNPKQQGIIVVEDVNDETYTNATAVFEIMDKSISFSPDFKNKKPVYNVKASFITTLIEVVENYPDKTHLKRNKEFLTDAVIEKLKAKIILDMQEVVNFCKANKVDLMECYKNFHALKTKEFNEYFKEKQEKYLDEIDFKFDIKISSAD